MPLGFFVSFGGVMLFGVGGCVFAMWLKRSARRMSEEQSEQSD